MITFYSQLIKLKKDYYHFSNSLAKSFRLVNPDLIRVDELTRVRYSLITNIYYHGAKTTSR